MQTMLTIFDNVWKAGRKHAKDPTLELIACEKIISMNSV